MGRRALAKSGVRRMLRAPFGEIGNILDPDFFQGFPLQGFIAIKNMLSQIIATLGKMFLDLVYDLIGCIMLTSFAVRVQQIKTSGKLRVELFSKTLKMSVSVAHPILILFCSQYSTSHKEVRFA